MPGTAATLVTQTRVREGKDEAFAQWQQAMSEAAADRPGFIEQTVMPTVPPGADRLGHPATFCER